MSEASRSPIALMAALGAAIAAVMILALLTPRMGEAESVNWLFTLVGGAIAGAATYFFLSTRTADENPHQDPPR